MDKTRSVGFLPLVVFVVVFLSFQVMWLRQAGDRAAAALEGIRLEIRDLRKTVKRSALQCR